MIYPHIASHAKPHKEKAGQRISAGAVPKSKHLLRGSLNSPIRTIPECIQETMPRHAKLAGRCRLQKHSAQHCGLGRGHLGYPFAVPSRVGVRQPGTQHRSQYEIITCGRESAPQSSKTGRASTQLAIIPLPTRPHSLCGSLYPRLYPTLS